MKATPTSKDVSFHVITHVGYGREGRVKYYICQNSRGRKWGYRGYCKISKDLVGRMSFLWVLGFQLTLPVQLQARLEKVKFDWTLLFVCHIFMSSFYNDLILFCLFMIRTCCRLASHLPDVFFTVARELMRLKLLIYYLV